MSDKGTRKTFPLRKPLRSGDRSDVSQTIAKALRSALDMEVLRSLSPVALGLAALYVIFAISHALFLPPTARTQMALTAVLTALVLFLIGYELRRLPVPANWAHPVGAGIAALVLFNSLLHLYLLKEPQQTTNVALLIIGVGCFFLSARWLALVIAASICGWVLVENFSGPSLDWRHFGFMLLAAALLSALVHAVRVRTLQQLELMHILNERRREELEEAIEAAQQSEERFRQLSEAAFEGVAVHEQGQLLNVNQSLAKMFGYALDNLREMSALDLVAPESRPFVLERLLSGSEISFEALGIRRDDSTFPVEICSKAVPYDERTVSVMAIRDISERKRVEEEHHRLVREQAARAEAEAANQIKDQFLATLSHELRTPLAAIIGWAHMLRAGTLDEVGIARALEVIERKAYAQNQLIDDLLDVSRIITGKLRIDMHAFDLRTVIETAVAAVRPTASNKSIEIQTAFDADSLRIEGDSDRLQQVMLNLLNNAIKFTPAGGRVSVRLERAAEVHARISVTDTGIGIAVEFLPHVFDRFRQADSSTTREHGGLGLGLAIVQHLVELHGGTVQASSGGKGEGATFTVLLPLAPKDETLEADLASQKEPLEFAHAAAVSAPLTKLKGVRVLVVDDDADTLAMLGTALSYNGADVRLAVDATGALGVLEIWKPDVLVSDIGMPGQDGYVLIKRIRSTENGQRLPAIALTAYAKEEDRALALAAGYHLHISKPVEPEHLINAVSSLREQE